MRKNSLLPLLLLLLSCSSQTDDQVSSKGQKSYDVQTSENITALPSDSIKEAKEIQESWLVKTVEKDGYYYIPETVCGDSVRAVLHPLYHPDRKFKDKKVFEIYWGTSCNDGSYQLLITPEQIFLVSGHENPNPNHLYWVQNLTPNQYNQIVSSLKAQTPDGFEDLSEPYPERYVFKDMSYKESLTIPEYWTEKHLEEFHSTCEVLKRKQVEKLNNTLNSMIAMDAEKLNLTKFKTNKMTPRLFGYSSESLRDWVKITSVNKVQP
jgi:hypothetical protein